MQRRSFLTGLCSMLAAPAIVHAGNLMPIKTGLIPAIDTWLVHGLDVCGLAVTKELSREEMKNFFHEGFFSISTIEAPNLDGNGRFVWSKLETSATAQLDYHGESIPSDNGLVFGWSSITRTA